jgi:hypothetical protein
MWGSDYGVKRRWGEEGKRGRGEEGKGGERGRGEEEMGVSVVF